MQKKQSGSSNWRWIIGHDYGYKETDPRMLPLDIEEGDLFQMKYCAAAGIFKDGRVTQILREAGKIILIKKVTRHGWFKKKIISIETLEEDGRICVISAELAMLFFQNDVIERIQRTKSPSWVSRFIRSTREQVTKIWTQIKQKFHLPL
jgi:hypothetical protein